MYKGDSFFNLTVEGQVGLAIISGVLIFLAIGAVRLARRKIAPRAAAPAVGLVLWWLFVWLSPQVYYIYYMFLFDDLPLQLVVGLPPGAVRLIELLTLQGKATLADHALGLLGWTMMAVALPKA